MNIRKLEKQELETLFKNYLQKKASPEEVLLLLEYFKLDKHSEQLNELIMAEMQRPLQEDNVIRLVDNELYNRVEQALNARFDERKERVAYWRKYLIRITAAAAIVLLIGGYALWNNLRPVTMTTVYAAYGKTLELHLPDSSKVLLNSGTTISYPSKFKRDSRLVILSNGEAFFEIMHDAKKPFIVKTKSTNVTVLGTSFDVSTFARDKETKVTVSTGKVGVMITGIKDTANYLTPGEQLSVDNTSKTVHRSFVSLSDIAAWREQRLIFEEQPLSEVMQSLERKYNVAIKIDNKKLLSEKISMRLNNQPLTDVLTAISFANHFNYVKINDQLIVVK